MSFKLRLLLFYTNYITKDTSYDGLSPTEVRQRNDQELKSVGSLVDFPALPMSKIENLNISMRDNAEIPIRIYKPTEKQQLPTIVYFHGGGFVTRDIESHDKVCRRIAHTCEAVVVSVGYRLAPEHKFPTPPNDAYDATIWVTNNARKLGGDPDNLIVMGDSAGGNLAAVTAIQARDLNGPKITKQVLIYPTTDARMQQPSIDTLGKGYFLTKSIMSWFLNHYKAKEEDILNPLMSPLLTEDLSNLPAAFVSTCALDPLKDEGEAYANRLTAAANQVYFKEYKNVIHGFINMPRIMNKTLRLHEDIRDFIR